MLTPFQDHIRPGLHSLLNMILGFQSISTLSPADTSLPLRLCQQEVQKEIRSLEAEKGLAVFLSALPQTFHLRKSRKDQPDSSFYLASKTCLRLLSVSATLWAAPPQSLVPLLLGLLSLGSHGLAYSGQVCSVYIEQMSFQLVGVGN